MSCDLYATSYVTDVGYEVFVDAAGHEFIYDPLFDDYIEVKIDPRVKPRERHNWIKEGF